MPGYQMVSWFWMSVLRVMLNTALSAMPSSSAISALFLPSFLWPIAASRVILPAWTCFWVMVSSSLLAMASMAALCSRSRIVCLLSWGFSLLLLAANMEPHRHLKGCLIDVVGQLDLELHGATDLDRNLTDHVLLAASSREEDVGLGGEALEALVPPGPIDRELGGCREIGLEEHVPNFVTLHGASLVLAVGVNVDAEVGAGGVERLDALLD